MPSPDPSSFQYNTIRQKPELLKRLSTPDQYQNALPSPESCVATADKEENDANDFGASLIPYWPTLTFPSHRIGHDADTSGSNDHDVGGTNEAGHAFPFKVSTSATDILRSSALAQESPSTATHQREGLSITSTLELQAYMQSLDTIHHSTREAFRHAQALMVSVNCAFDNVQKFFNMVEYTLELGMKQQENARAEAERSERERRERLEQEEEERRQRLDHEERERQERWAKEDKERQERWAQEDKERQERWAQEDPTMNR